MHSPPDPNLGAHVLVPPPSCVECGAPGLIDSPLTQSPWGPLCPSCAVQRAVDVLTPDNRATRRRRFKAEGKKGDRNRKRRRR